MAESGEILLSGGMQKSVNRPGYRARKPGIFGDAKTVRDLSLHKSTEIRDNGPATAGSDSHDRKEYIQSVVHAIQLDRIFVIPAGDVTKYGGEQVGTVSSPNRSYSFSAEVRCGCQIPAQVC